MPAASAPASWETGSGGYRRSSQSRGEIGSKSATSAARSGLGEVNQLKTPTGWMLLSRCWKTSNACGTRAPTSSSWNRGSRGAVVRGDEDAVEPALAYPSFHSGAVAMEQASGLNEGEAGGA